MCLESEMRIFYLFKGFVDQTFLLNHLSSHLNSMHGFMTHVQRWVEYPKIVLK